MSNATAIQTSLSQKTEVLGLFDVFSPYYDARAAITKHLYFANYTSSMRVLDFGCGTGYHIAHLSNAVGFDPSAEHVEACHKRGLNATTDLGILPNESFNLVFSSHYLPVLPNPAEALQQIWHKLLPGGRIILELPLEDDSRVPTELRMDEHHHLFAWNFRTINNLLFSNGFKVTANQVVQGAGYRRWLPLYRYSFQAYRFATWLTAYMGNIKEMVVVAEKVNY
ncbi:MAG: class I SAM-dependent methyltransferase [Bernardetiaceae bacterium]|jgi:SAM-dependent methyltransferase|nr:class I SAM-dependent methyltransferase [Bernardetiaceae bacterium]